MCGVGVHASFKTSTLHRPRMNQFLHQFLAYLGASTVLFAVVAYFARAYINALITARVNARAQIEVGKAIEAYKLDLNKALEQWRSNLAIEAQRTIQEHGLFAGRKHKVWAKLYGLVLTADGKAMVIPGRHVGLTYEEYDLSDLLELARTEGFASGIRTQLEQLWTVSGREEALRYWKQCERSKRWNEAVSAWDEAHNYIFFNALYLSAEVYDIANGALDPIWDFIIEMYPPPPHPSERVRVDNIKRTIAEKLNLLKQTLTTEMLAAALVGSPGVQAPH